MIEIRPVSDLRNNFPQIEELVMKNNKPVYLTKNGHGVMVVMSIQEYSELMEKVEKLDTMESMKQKTDLHQPASEELYRKVVNRISGK